LTGRVFTNFSSDFAGRKFFHVSVSDLRSVQPVPGERMSYDRSFARARNGQRHSYESERAYGISHVDLTNYFWRQDNYLNVWSGLDNSISAPK
jgi:hypothetical protein